MKVLIKLGGALLDEAESRQRLAHEIAAAAADSADQFVVVHGGGKQMTRFLTERGVESHFVNGLRVTTDEVLDSVLKVLGGSVNRGLTASFIAAGANAVGLSGVDGLLAEAEPISEELGHVGRPVRANGALLNLLVANGYLPVVACVGADRSGRLYNVNADQMAVACAGAFRADKLLFLTDVPGVKDASGEVRPQLTPADCRGLIGSGVVHGGMQAKLEAAMNGLASGVGEVVIAPGAKVGIVAELLAGSAIGTRVAAVKEGVLANGN